MGGSQNRYPLLLHSLLCLALWEGDSNEKIKNNHEEYHQEMILTNYPDTYDFLYSVYNELNVLGDY